MKIFYVHHAVRAKGNPPSQEDGITPLGKKDTKLVAEMFEIYQKAGRNIKAIYTSPYFRCKETARRINKYIKVPIIEDERLNEFGSVYALVKGDATQSKGKESWEECQKRIIDCLKEITFKYDDNDTVLCVTSGVNITAFIDVAYKIKPSNNLPFPMVFSCSPVGFDINKDCFKN